MIKSFMAIVILLLLGLAAWQELRVSSLKADVEQSRREVDCRAIARKWSRPLPLSMICIARRTD